jgi:hypothetical protein
VTKVVINRCCGGFSLSQLAQERLYQMGSEYVREMDDDERSESIFGADDRFMVVGEIPRHDRILLRVIAEIGTKEASGSYAELEVIEIPGTLYRVTEYDGLESVETPEKLDWVNASKPAETVDFK